MCRGGWLVEMWVDNYWSQCSEGGEVRSRGSERACGRWSILAQIVLKCLKWTVMSLLNVQCCVRTRVLPFHQTPGVQAAVEGGSTQGCSSSTICSCCATVKPPSWGKTQWEHRCSLNRWVLRMPRALRTHRNFKRHEHAFVWKQVNWKVVLMDTSLFISFWSKHF